MPPDVWTTEFLINREIRLKGISHFKNISPICTECFFSFKKDKCYIVLKIGKDFIYEGRKILEQIVSAEADIIADIMAWEYEVGLEEIKVYPGIPEKLEFPSRKESEDANFKYSGMFTGEYTEKNMAILSGYRQIKNESNSALRYLMNYRMLEMIASERDINVDNLIRDYKIKTKFIKDQRNRKNLKSFVSYFRNKIHATDKSYRFPVHVLEAFLPEIEKVVNATISRIISG